ncbi:MAG: Lactate utilization protein B [Promethearchaeota archaeon]|nr:MAG: Lactate utilization protein B [Candidatus Lokiarchaeota archaeon]
MSNKGQELYEEIKDKIADLEKKDSYINEFTEFWRMGCSAKYKAYELQFMYDESSREFVEKNKAHIKEIREDFVENMDQYVKNTIEIMEKANHFKVHYAKTNEEAQQIFLEELGDNTVVYKSKSNEAKDIGLIDAMRENDIEVKETDLGDIILGLFDDYELPTYQLGPGAHFNEEDIVTRIKEKYGVELEPDAEKIVEYFRNTYRKELLNDVKVSLTSANAISAEDGTIVLGENEGNISLLTRTTDKHIVACGITKIVPTLYDAVLIMKLQERINYVPLAYINLISGPSNTSDIQGKRVHGMYGAKEVVVILVDDWRTKAAKEHLIYEDFLKCLSCKSCIYTCAAFRAFGNIYGSKYGLGGVSIVRDYIHNGIEAAIKDGLFLCTGCETCAHWCPAGVNIGDIIRDLKKEATEKGLCPPPLEGYKNKILDEKNPFK